MARTRRAPWDYERIQPPAPYNAHCPICGHACYDSRYPDGSTYYSCPKCGIVTQADIENIQAERDRQAEISFARYGNLGEPK